MTLAPLLNTTTAAATPTPTPLNGGAASNNHSSSNGRSNGSRSSHSMGPAVVTGGSVGVVGGSVSFAIPIDKIKSVVSELNRWGGGWGD